MALTWRAAVLGLTLSLSAFGADVGVLGRVVKHSCGYYSATTGDFTLAYGALLPVGTRVTALYGLGGTQGKSPLLWQERGRTHLSPTVAQTWVGTLGVTLHGRGRPLAYTELELLFRLELPSGQIIYDTGYYGSRGYYAVRIPTPSAPCIRPGEPLPKAVPFTVHRVSTDR
jgi:hypothetical protein